MQMLSQVNDIVVLPTLAISEAQHVVCRVVCTSLEVASQRICQELCQKDWRVRCRVAPGSGPHYSNGFNRQVALLSVKTHLCLLKRIFLLY